MREIRPSSLEGGVRLIPHPYPYPQQLAKAPKENGLLLFLSEQSADSHLRFSPRACRKIG
jgi:hypothetical protein